MSKGIKVTGMIIIVLGALLLISSGISYISSSVKANYGEYQSVDAFVLDAGFNKRVFPRKGYSCETEIRYQVGSTVYEEEDNKCMLFASRGDSVEIYYNISDPTKHFYASNLSLSFVLWSIPVLLGAVVIKFSDNIESFIEEKLDRD